MQKSNAMLVTVISVLWCAPALAEVQCEPVQDGNTWNLVCSVDGRGNSDNQCDYELSLTTQDGFSDTVNASGSVDQDQVGPVIIWSGIQHQGSDIVSVSIVNGSCHPW